MSIPRLPAPHPAIPVAGAAAILIASYPSTLPRSPVVAAVVTAVLCVVATVPVAFATRRRIRQDNDSSPDRTGRVVVAAAAVSVVAVIGSGYWQALLRDQLAAAAGTEPAGALFAWQWAAVVAGPALALAAAVIWCPRVTAVAAAMVTALAGGYLPAAGAADTPARTGDQVLYSALPQGDYESTIERRAQTLAERWRDARTDRDAPIVIAVPTGSGWVDPDAVEGVRMRWGSRVTVLALQYADAPSWRVFAGDRGGAGRSAAALLRALITTVPRDELPPVYLYGQSLGAIGADDAREWARTHAPGVVAGTVLAGPPDGSVARRSDTPRTIIANRSDPVARWSPALLWRPAADAEGTIRTGVRLSRPPWLPVVSFLQTTVDLAGSLDGPKGTGHRYGTEQGLWIGRPVDRTNDNSVR